MPTIKTALAEATRLLQHVTDTPLLEAEILLSKALLKNRPHLRAWPEKELTPEQDSAYQTLLNERRSGQPIAYLTGTREFWSREFIVTSDVLIPRPETELLIELSLTLIPADKPCNIIDLGTGTGIIAVTLAAERRLAQVTAADISPAALSVAKKNAANHHTEHIQFYQSDWLDNVPKDLYDLIVSNPPYIAENDTHLHQGDLRFEPKTALIAQDQGLADIKTIAETAYERLENGGYLLVEHGFEQDTDVQRLFIANGYKQVSTVKDLAGLPRVTMGRYLNESR